MLRTGSPLFLPGIHHKRGTVCERVATMTISGETMTVDCSGSPPAQSAQTRVVTSMPANKRPAPRATPWFKPRSSLTTIRHRQLCLQLISTTTCGTGMTINSWVITPANHNRVARTSSSRLASVVRGASLTKARGPQDMRRHSDKYYITNIIGVDSDRGNPGCRSWCGKLCQVPQGALACPVLIPVARQTLPVRLRT